MLGGRKFGWSARHFLRFACTSPRGKNGRKVRHRGPWPGIFVRSFRLFLAGIWPLGINGLGNASVVSRSINTQGPAIRTSRALGEILQAIQSVLDQLYLPT